MAGASGSFLLVGAAAAAIWLLPPLFARISSRQLDHRTSLPLVRASLAMIFLVMLLAEAMGSEPVLAAILAGFLLGRIIPRGSPRPAIIGLGRTAGWESGVRDGNITGLVSEIK